MSESKPVDPSTGSGQSSGLRILYMEDDPGLAHLFQKKLERAGYAVDLACDGQEGLAMYDAGSYDVVVVDHVMPVHDGLGVIRLLADRGPLPPTIMITGLGSEQVAVEAMKLGALDYIVKDVDVGYLDLLPTVIEQALRHQCLAEEKKRAEEALRESERRHRHLIEFSDDLIFSVDRAGVFQTAGGARLREFGLSPKDIVGHSLDVLFGQEAARHQERHLQVFESGTAMTYEHTFEFAGVTRTDLTTIYSIKDEQGNVEQVGVICRDITARVRAEQEQEKLIAELQDALAQVKTLSGLLPICVSCKRIRDDKGYWTQVEFYIQEHTEAEFSHSICPKCAKKLYPDLYLDDK